VRLRSSERTLTDQEVADVRDRVVAAARDAYAAELRGA
jgi:phenylalanyl-tRNA synthetase beta subunit